MTIELTLVGIESQPVAPEPVTVVARNVQHVRQVKAATRLRMMDGSDVDVAEPRDAVRAKLVSALRESRG